MGTNISSLDTFIKRVKKNELSGLKSGISKDHIDLFRSVFRAEITKAYEAGIRDAVNLSINKDDQIEIYKSKYFEETFVDGYLLSEEEINQCRDIKDVLELRNTISLIPSKEKTALLIRTKSELSNNLLGRLFAGFFLTAVAVIFIRLIIALIYGDLALNWVSGVSGLINILFIIIGIIKFNYYNKIVLMKRELLNDFNEKTK